MEVTDLKALSEKQRAAFQQVVRRQISRHRKSWEESWMSRVSGRFGNKKDAARAARIVCRMFITASEAF